MPKLGTVCHRGHEMQGTVKAYVSILEDGTCEMDGPPLFDFLEDEKEYDMKRHTMVYCGEDCNDIPQKIIRAAVVLLQDAYPVLP